MRKHTKPLQRQIHEAVNINSKSKEENLNSKSEFNSQSIERLSLDTIQKIIDCKICGQLFTSSYEAQNHEELFHSRNKCTLCVYISFGLRDLSEHIKNNHSNNENNK